MIRTVGYIVLVSRKRDPYDQKSPMCTFARLVNLGETYKVTERHPHASASIAMYTLDVEMYRPELLNSLRRQVLQPCELVVSDDDSTDGTAA